jgi:enterochelin esterase-like enzyme
MIYKPLRSSMNRKGLLITLLLLMTMNTQLSAQGNKMTPGDTLTSVSVGADHSVTLRIYAPQASEVKIGGPDFPEPARNVKMVKSADGVWEAAMGAVPPGSYRYTFMVDNLSVVDPRNPKTSESNANTWSLMHVPGADFMDMQNVPHGAVSEVTYYSTSLGRFRRMHVYTPPGYESGEGTYPVFYLLHGAFDCDASWSSVGRAGIIFDNLIAQKKAVPMVVVMPAGHTGPFMFGRPRAASGKPAADEFIEDFQRDVKPYAEAHYRVTKDRAHRAIAGLSMGGAQTLNIAFPHLEEYSAIGVFSSGIFELNGAPTAADRAAPTWEERNRAVLENKQLKDGLDLVWFATGKDDFLLSVSRNSVALLKGHGFNVVFKETEGGHTWANWREYLNEFAPQLFRTTVK